MDKNEVLKILETAKEENGEVPMRLVRQAFEKLSEPCEDAVGREAVGCLLYELYESCTSMDELVSCMESNIKILPSVTPEHRWIPCSERLPEEDDYKPFLYYEDGVVLFCTKNGRVGFGWYYESTKEWANEYDHTPGEVIAWMTLPEPYGGEQE